MSTISSLRFLHFSINFFYYGFEMFSRICSLWFLNPILEFLLYDFWLITYNYYVTILMFPEFLLCEFCILQLIFKMFSRVPPLRFLSTSLGFFSMVFEFFYWFVSIIFFFTICWVFHLGSLQDVLTIFQEFRLYCWWILL